MRELNPKMRLFLDFLMLTVGSAIAPFAIEEFLVPCTILDGGVIGIGIMVNNLTHIPLSILTIVQGYFNMMMIADTAKCEKDGGTLAKELENLGKEIGVVIHCQHEDIFNMMHRV